MSWSSTIRATEAAARRQEREAQKRMRELERRAKELAKLSELEQAKLEVERFENRLEVLISIHKQPSLEWNWKSVAASLPPPHPAQLRSKEFRARQCAAVNMRTNSANAAKFEIEQAIAADENDYKLAVASHSSEIVEWQKMRALALRVLQGEHKAYIEALTELSPLSELSDLGSSLHFTIHSDAIIGCTIKVNGTQAIPTEVKSLTSTGKLSVKTMPRIRFHEIYQDHICSGILRVAREVFALLPMHKLIVTATADLDYGSYNSPVLSVVIDRTQMQELDFEHLDPSDSVEGFPYRGDFKASRREGVFQSITPFSITEVHSQNIACMTAEELLIRTRNLRAEILVLANQTPGQLTHN